MSLNTLNNMIRQIDLLTVEEQLRLAEQLVAHARAANAKPRPHRKWREIRGMARPSLLGEDAQVWVSRTRREADEQRARSTRKLP